MPGWVEDLLKEMFYGPFYQLAKVVWDWCIGLSTGVISQDPQHFSPATWKFVTETLYPWAMGMLWSSIFVTLMANKIGGLQFGIYRNCQISSRVFHTAVAALPLTKANRSDFE